MLFERLRNNFKIRGYDIAVFTNADADVFFAVKEIYGTIYAISVVDHTGIKKLGYKEYDNIMRVFRDNIIIKHTVEDIIPEFRLLQVVCTYDAALVPDVVMPFYPHWVLDLQNDKLMVYENQPASFLDAEDIIRDTLEGRSYYREKYGNDREEYENQKQTYAHKTAKAFPVVTLGIIMANAAVFIYMLFNGSAGDMSYFYAHGAISFESVVEHGEYYRLFTHFFMHDGIEHIANNMLLLGIVGYYFEGEIGRLRYFMMYMVSGLAAGIVSMEWYHYFGKDVYSLGASGAVFGACGAMIAMIVADRELYRGIGPFKIVMFLILTLYSGIRNEGIDNVAHVAGFITGVAVTLLILLMRKGKVVDES